MGDGLFRGLENICYRPTSYSRDGGIALRSSILGLISDCFGFETALLDSVI